MGRSTWANDRNDDSSSLVGDYAAGRSYRDVFGSAVRGPLRSVPTYYHHSLSFPRRSFSAIRW